MQCMDPCGRDPLPLGTVRAIAAAVSVILGLALAQPAAAQVLVPPGSTWLYLDDGTDQGTAWRAPGFVETGWSQGPAQLGFSEGDEATLIAGEGHVTY